MRRISSCLLLIPMLALSGCETVAVGVATPIIVQKRHVNVVNASYAAIDTITQQTSPRLKIGAPVVISPLREIVPEQDESGVVPNRKVHENPNLGQNLTAQMKTRFSQLGYAVMNETTSDPIPNNAVEFSGTYQIYGTNFVGSGGTLKVSLRLINRTTNRVIGVHDYTIPVTDEVRKYMADGNTLMPKIFRD